jgi:hypothetical protein
MPPSPRIPAFAPTRARNDGLQRKNDGLQHKKDATGLLPSRPNFCNSLVQAPRAPWLRSLEVSLAGDPSEVTALGVRHWITSFRCWWKPQYRQGIAVC